MEDYEEYFKHARLLTELHAIPKELKKLENNATEPLKGGKQGISENTNEMN